MFYWAEEGPTTGRLAVIRQVRFGFGVGRIAQKQVLRGEFVQSGSGLPLFGEWVRHEERVYVCEGEGRGGAGRRSISHMC